MTQFDTAEIERLTARDRLMRRIALPVCAAIIVTGIIAATMFAGGEERFVTAYLVLLAVDAFAVAAFFACSLAIYMPNAAKLKREVRRIMYADLSAHSKLFEGDDVMMSVVFEKDALRISTARGERAFDLKAIRGAPSVYSACGNMLYDYILAYWQSACERGFKGNARCFDLTDPKDREIILVKDGVPTKRLKNADEILAYGKGAEK